MTAPRARARAEGSGSIPTNLETSFAETVGRIVRALEVESRRIGAKVEAGELGVKDTRVLIDLARACQSLQSGTLWGARAILAKTATQKPDDK